MLHNNKAEAFTSLENKNVFYSLNYNIDNSVNLR